LEGSSSSRIDTALSSVLADAADLDSLPANAAEAMLSRDAAPGENKPQLTEQQALKKKEKARKRKQNQREKKKQLKKLGKPAPKQGKAATNDDEGDEGEDIDEAALNAAAMEFYKRAEKLSVQKKKLQAEKGTEKAKQRLVTDEDGTRAISRDIERNKGLLPSRKKEYRNPRVRQRKRFQRAQKKRKARVKEAVGEVPSYRGEATGIRRTVIKSVALH